VLRGGLTPKRVDVLELMRVLRYEVLADPVVHPVSEGPGLVSWRPPVAEFALSRATPAEGPVTMPSDGPRILICVAGTASVSGTPLESGAAVFVGADEPPVVVSGTGTVFQASTPRSS
jgi:mannose-6-phosphate isomerase